MDFLWIIILVVMLPLLGFALARQIADGRWDTYSQHKCGHIQRWGYLGVCGKCGEGGDWKPVVAKARFPFGWEIKK